MTNFETALIGTCQDKGFYPRVIGSVNSNNGNYPIWFVQTAYEWGQEPKALVVAGFHGEELAGPWAILRWLQTCTVESFKGVNVSFLPVVNLYGFRTNQRYGPSGIPTNAGFYRTNEQISPEGAVLKKNIDLLRMAASEGYLSLHEDNTASEFYMYTFEPTEKPGEFTREIKAELIRHFPHPFTGVAYVNNSGPGKGPPCEDGLVYRFFDGTFDDWLFQLGVRRVAVTETPGKYPFMERVEASVDLIDKFIDLISRGV